MPPTPVPTKPQGIDKSSEPIEEKVPVAPAAQSETVKLLVGLRVEDQRIEEAEIREMTGRDEEAVSAVLQGSSVDVGKALTTLLASCCTHLGPHTPDKMSKPDWFMLFRQMTVADRDYLMLRLRVLSFGNILEQDFKCDDCGTKFTGKIDLEKMDHRFIVDDPAAYTFDLPRGYTDHRGVHKKVVMKLPTGLDQERLIQGMSQVPAEQATLFLTSCVAMLGTIETPPVNVFRDLSSRDRSFLLREIVDRMPGPDLVVKTTCPSCQETITERIESTNFFTA